MCLLIECEGTQYKTGTQKAIRADDFGENLAFDEEYSLLAALPSSNVSLSLVLHDDNDLDIASWQCVASAKIKLTDLIRHPERFRNRWLAFEGMIDAGDVADGGVGVDGNGEVASGAGVMGASKFGVVAEIFVSMSWSWHSAVQHHGVLTRCLSSGERVRQLVVLGQVGAACNLYHFQLDDQDDAPSTAAGATAASEAQDSGGKSAGSAKKLGWLRIRDALNLGVC